MPLLLLLTKERFLYANLYGMFPKLSSKALIGVFNYGFIRRIGITERIKLPTFIFICFFGFSPHNLLSEEKTTYQNFHIF